MNNSKRKRNKCRSILIKERSQLSQTPQGPFIEVDMSIVTQPAIRNNMTALHRYMGSFLR